MDDPIDLTGAWRICELRRQACDYYVQHASQCVVATGPEGDGEAPRRAHRDRYGDADRRVGAASVFGTPPSILGALSDSEGEGDSVDGRMWVIDEARHLLDTFGGRAVREWFRCGRDGCDDVSCICHFVREGINHYGDWAESIASILASVATMADDEAMEDTQPTEPYDSDGPGDGDGGCQWP